MLRLVIRSVSGRWRQYLMTVVAVVLGVSFVVGAFVLTDSLAAGIDRLLSDSVSHADVVVRPSGEGALHRAAAASGIDLGTGLDVPASLVADLRRLPGVAIVDASIAGPGQLFGKQGQADRFDLTTVTNWPAHPSLRAERLVSGRAPRRPSDAVIDTDTARSRSLRIGSRLRVGTEHGLITARVSGIAERAGGSLGAAGSILAFSTHRARQLVGRPGRVDDISIRARPGANIRNEVVGALPPGVTALRSQALLSGAHQRIDLSLHTFVGVLLGFAVVILFVTTFLIWNTFSIVAAQRAPERALLRAVGASRRQIAGAVLAEGAIVGTVSAGAGLALGVGLAALLRTILDRLGIELPHGHLLIEPRTVAIAIAVGLGITLLSTVGPALRATTASPMAALSMATTPAGPPGLGAAVVGIGLVGVGTGAGIVGLVSTSATVAIRLGWVATGAVALMAGSMVLLPRVMSPMASGVDRLLGSRQSVAGRLARRNAARTARRTGSNASALMVGVALVSATLVVGSSFERAFQLALGSSITAQVVVDTVGVVPLDGHALAAIRSTDGVTHAVPIGRSQGELRSPSSPRLTTASLSAVDPVALARVMKVHWPTGRAPARPDQIALSASLATRFGLHVGDHLEFGTGTVRPLTISGIYDRNDLLGDSLLPWATAAGTHPEVRVVLVETASDPARTARRLARAVAAVPNSEAGTTDQFIAGRSNAVDLVVGVVDVVLLLAVAVAAMSIADTLGLSVLERTRELGLLRAVGMTRADMRRMVRWEGGTVSLLGGVAGTAVGVAFGTAVAYVLPSHSTRVSLPLADLALVLVGSIVLGLAAGLWPARRAARLNPMEAIVDF